MAALVAAMIGMAATASATTTHAVTGEARDPRSARLLYREHHLLRLDGERPIERVVLYRCADGTAFARKRVDYRASRIAPDFALIDARDDHREGLRRAGDVVHVWSGTPSTRSLRGAHDLLVADAGFDEYLRGHWTALTQGSTQVVPFAVPAFGRALDFRIRRLDRGAIDGVPVERFRLTLDGMLGAVAPAMDVAYDTTHRRLRRFVGLTGIRDARGHLLRARIDFADAPVQADDAAWTRAVATPLKACVVGG